LHASCMVGDTMNVSSIQDIADMQKILQN
jgi:hypothetical protein